MDEMIERVGDALAKACLDEFGSTWSNDVRWKFARAAIEAMRVPTRKMVNASREISLGNGITTIDAVPTPERNET